MTNYKPSTKDFESILDQTNQAFKARALKQTSFKRNLALKGAELLAQNDSISKLLDTREGLLWFLSIKPNKIPNIFNYVRGNQKQKELTGEGFFNDYINLLREVSVKEAYAKENSWLGFKTLQQYYSEAVSAKTDDLKRNFVVVWSCTEQYGDSLFNYVIKSMAKVANLATNGKMILEIDRPLATKMLELVSKQGKKYTKNAVTETQIEWVTITNCNKKAIPSPDIRIGGLPNDFFKLLLKNPNISLEKKRFYRETLLNATFEFYGVSKEVHPFAYPTLAAQFSSFLRKFRVSDTGTYPVMEDEEGAFDNIKELISEEKSEKVRVKQPISLTSFVLPAQAIDYDEDWGSNISEIVNLINKNQVKLEKGLFLFRYYSSQKVYRFEQVANPKKQMIVSDIFQNYFFAFCKMEGNTVSFYLTIPGGTWSKSFSPRVRNTEITLSSEASEGQDISDNSFEFQLTDGFLAY